MPSRRPPALSYGRQPAAGAVAITRQADGSVDIEVTPQPWWYLPAIIGLLAVVPLGAAVYGWRHGSLAISLVLIVAPMGVALLTWITLFRAILRHHAFIHAGPDGVRILYTEQGDEVRIEFPPGAVRQASPVRTQGGGWNVPGIALALSTGEKRIPLHRSRRDLQRICEAMNAALNAP